MLKTVSLTLVLLGLCASARAADEEGKAKTYYDRGTAAFALGKFNDAAAAYERAFELRPDPAILYNAAQAHRLAGNKSRALELYTSYLRIYGKGAPNRAEVQGHITELKKAIDHDARVASSPPLGTIPAKSENGSETVPPTPVEPPPVDVRVPTDTPPTVDNSTPTTTTQANTSVSLTVAPERKPITKKAWFWAAVGGGVVVLTVAIVLGVTLGGSSHVDPAPTYGIVRGN